MTDTIDWHESSNPLSWDLSDSMDWTSYGIVSAAKFVCKIPDGLGAPTSIKVNNGKIVVGTESGITMICGDAK